MIVRELSNGCSGATGSDGVVSTIPVSDLGPNDDRGATNGTADFLFVNAGEYVLCYNLYFGAVTDYLQVNTSFDVFSGAHPILYRDTLLPLFHSLL
jgi:hypothetical protein